MSHQVGAGVDGVGVAVGDDEEVVGDGGDGVVVVVGDDDAVVLSPLADKFLDGFDAYRINLRKGLVQYVEGGLAHQHKIQLRQAGFATGKLPGGGIVVPGVLGEEVYEAPVVYAVQVEGATQFHAVRNQPALREVLYVSAYNLPVDGFFVDADHHVLHLQASHQGPEHAGLAGAVASQQARHHPRLGGDVAAAQDRFLAKPDHHAVYYELMLFHVSAVLWPA